MKTMIITLSPRKSFSTSRYFSRLLKFFMAQGDVRIAEIKTEQQYLAVEQQLDHLDNLVIVTPVYVDTLPSTVLDRLQRIEKFAKGRQLHLNVYALTNCGFYEGVQCELAQQTIQLWCDKCGFTFRGGLGVGAGVMIGFIRTLIPIGIGVTLAEDFIRAIIGIIHGTLSVDLVFLHIPYALIVQTCLYLLWSMGLFIRLIQMAGKVKSGTELRTRYTTVWFCPRFLFVIIASTYWVTASIFWYRGAFWRMCKEPE